MLIGTHFKFTHVCSFLIPEKEFLTPLANQREGLFASLSSLHIKDDDDDANSAMFIYWVYPHPTQKKRERDNITNECFVLSVTWASVCVCVGCDKMVGAKFPLPNQLPGPGRFIRAPPPLPPSSGGREGVWHDTLNKLAGMEHISLFLRFGQIIDRKKRIVLLFPSLFRSGSDPWNLLLSPSGLLDVRHSISDYIRTEKSPSLFMRPIFF